MGEQEDRREAFEGMLEYGRSTIRSVFLLNGGAILALLAFLSGILGHKPEANAALLLPALKAFTGGLAGAVCAWFCGYLNFASTYQRRPAWRRWTHVLAVAFGLGSLAAFICGVYLTSHFIQSL